MPNAGDNRSIEYGIYNAIYAVRHQHSGESAGFGQGDGLFRTDYNIACLGFSNGHVGQGESIALRIGHGVCILGGVEFFGACGNVGLYAICCWCRVSYHITLSSSFCTIYIILLHRLAGLQVSAIVYMGEFHSNNDRPIFVTMAALFLPLGTLYSPILAYGVLPLTLQYHMGSLVFSQWRFYIIVSTLIVIFTFTAVMFLPESPKFMLMMGRKEECLTALRRMYVINTRMPAEV